MFSQLLIWSCVIIFSSCAKNCLHQLACKLEIYRLKFSSQLREKRQVHRSSYLDLVFSLSKRLEEPPRDSFGAFSLCSIITRVTTRWCHQQSSLYTSSEYRTLLIKALYWSGGSWESLEDIKSFNLDISKFEKLIFSDGL